MSFVQRPANGLWLGIVVGLLVAAGLVATEEPRQPVEGNTMRASALAAQHFVDRWYRMRTGTWTVEGTFTRRLDDGRELTTTTFEAQRPPDRVRSASGSFEATASGRLLVCAAVEGVPSKCRDVGPAKDSWVEADTDRRAIDALVVGDARRYDVEEQTDSCFRLFQLPTPEVGRWGTSSQLCFDAPTGALRHSATTRPGGTDTTDNFVRSPTETDFDLSDRR